MCIALQRIRQPTSTDRVCFLPTVTCGISRQHHSIMTYTLEISDDLRDRLDELIEEDETYEELIEELVSIYETQGIFLQEGYSE